LIELSHGLEPKRVWTHFEKITQIPHCSGSEERIRAYTVECARIHQLPFRVDRVGNVLITKPPHPKMKGAPGVILQAHLDMVCEKNADVNHDFFRDPLRLRIEGDWLGAEGTTLGADNGIGVATALAILEDGSIVHGPLEVLFTIDEERGLIGASQLEGGMLGGVYLFNLDTEEEGTFCIGCAGGGDTFLRIPVERKERELDTGLEIRLFGLKGGHSGIDIHLGRANALKLLARILFFMKEHIESELVEIEGGDKHNAIPREALAHVYIPRTALSKVRAMVDALFGEIHYEYRYTEPTMNLKLEEYGCEKKPLTAVYTEKLINALMVLPHGVLAMSPTVKDLVETSTNLAFSHTHETHVEIVESSRSSLPSALEQVRGSLRAFSQMVPCSIEQPDSYPGWVPDPESPLIGRMKEVYVRLFGKEPEVKAVHAGLETAIIGEKVKGLKMISIGPDVRNPHSPEEKVNIPSVGRFWRLLTETLKELKD
jgi:dipeptidase D